MQKATVAAAIAAILGLAVSGSVFAADAPKAEATKTETKTEKTTETKKAGKAKKEKKETKTEKTTETKEPAAK